VMTIRENDGYATTEDYSHESTPRGIYDEEIDLVATGRRRPGTRALRRAAQEILERDYEPGMKVRRIVRTW
jgi:hypothetical protein